jgi:hypothetical protein
MRLAKRATMRPGAPRRLTGDAVIRLPIGAEGREGVASQSARRRNFALGIVGVILLALAFGITRVVNNRQRRPSSSDAVPTPAATLHLSPSVESAVQAVNTLSVFTLEQSATTGPDFNLTYAADGLRLLAAVLDAFIVRDSLVMDVDATTNQMRTEADRIERASEFTNAVTPTRAAFIAAAEIVTIVQRKNYPHLGQAVARLQDAARAIRENRPLREQSAEIEFFFQRASDALQGMTAVTS